MGDSQPRQLETRLARELLIMVGMVLLALIQITLLVTPLGFAVPFVLVVVICRVLIATSSGFPDAGISAGLRWCCYSGLTLDLFSSLPIGSHILAMLLPTVLLVLSVRWMRVESLWLPLLGVLIAAASYEALLATISQVWYDPIVWRIYLVEVVLPGMLVALVPTPFVYVLLRRMLAEV